LNDILIGHSNGKAEEFMKAMQIVASPRVDNSASKALSNYLIGKLKDQFPQLEVDYLDTSTHPPSHITSEFIEAMYTTPIERTESMKKILALSDALCAKVLMSDILIFGIPTCNFAMPSGFKAFIDHIVRNGLTYIINDDGSITGKVCRQRVVFITTREHDPKIKDSFDSEPNNLRFALIDCCNLIGVKSPIFLKCSPIELMTQEGELKNKSFVRAYKELDSIAKKLIKSIQSIACDKGLKL
jgi:FMN-dependent NADH-azoreductase